MQNLFHSTSLFFSPLLDLWLCFIPAKLKHSVSEAVFTEQCCPTTSALLQGRKKVTSVNDSEDLISFPISKLLFPASFGISALFPLIALSKETVVVSILSTGVAVPPRRLVCIMLPPALAPCSNQKHGTCSIPFVSIPCCLIGCLPWMDTYWTSDGKESYRCGKTYATIMCVYTLTLYIL